MFRCSSFFAARALSLTASFRNRILTCLRVAALGVAGAVSLSTLSFAQQTVVANYGNASLTIVDLATGDRTVLSSASVGTGPTFTRPVGTTREANGSIIVGLEATPSTIYRINPVTGDRSVLSSNAVGTGPAMGFIYGMATEANGDLIAAVYGSAAIYRINPVTGDRTVVTSASVGSGATMRSPFGVIVDPDGSIVFVPWNSGSEVIRVHPTTGARTVLSSASVGTGAALVTPTALVRLGDGSYAVLNGSTDYILRVDPATANRTVISSSTVGTGPTLGLRYSMSIDTSGNLYVADFSANSIVKIDPATGNRTTVSSGSVGTGTGLNQPLGMLGGAVGSIGTTPPSVTSTAAANITGTTADLGGDVTSGGTASVTDRGVVWSVTATNATPTLGGTGVTTVAIGSGTGVFSQTVTGLPAGTALSFRAYATNTGGTTYGSVLTFTTAASNAAPTDLSLSNSSINQTAGVNATVGTLSTTDTDSVSFTYSLVSGSGSTDNASFNISSSTLRANNAAALAAGTYAVRIQTDDGSGGTFAKSFTVTVIDTTAPVITSGTTASATYRTAFSGYTITASGGATSFGATGLPSGLSVNTSTGAITGTPTQSGTFTVSLSATDASSNTGTGSLTLTVATVPLTVSGVTAADKTFDGTTAATLDFTSAALVGVASGDTVTLNSSGATATFATASVGFGKTVTITGLALGGTHAAHYTLTPPTTTASITSAGAVVAFGTLSFTYDGSAHPATVTTTPSGLTVTITYDGLTTAPTNAGSYAVSAVVGTAGYSGSASGTLTIARAAQTVTFVDPGTIATSTPVTLNATASSGLPVTFSVVSGNATLSGATLTVHDVLPVTLRASQAGNTNYLAAQAEITVAAPRTDRLIGLASRGRVTPDSDRRVIAGFVISGTGTQRVLLRAIGPALTSFGVTEAHANPRLQLYSANGTLLLENDDWTADPTVFAEVGAFPLPAGSRDAAIVTTLAPGAYTMHVVGGSQSGVALAEIYDATVGDRTGKPRIVDISARGSVDSGEGVLIAGFILEGNAPRKVLIRGVGPTLAVHGVNNVLPDARLGIYSGQSLIARNDNWETPQAVTGSSHVAASAAEITSAIQACGAFTFATGSKDSAVILTLPPGPYTAQVSSPAGQAGVALVEIYEVP